MLTNRHVHRHNKESVVFQLQKAVILYKEPFVRNYLNLHMHEKFKKIIEKKVPCMLASTSVSCFCIMQICFMKGSIDSIKCCKCLIFSSSVMSIFDVCRIDKKKIIW
ncbi:hypothetical protein J1N35_039501 [Gossypium stocksii]|uniref:Uncharacterized protein n=1 Tax=Gossypium stocksii TaxID=47602 RepID=A0A9D3UNX0_9ROSI|nr:hypothetical protein J1N35_039501 [Gossypium stocksii]